MASESNSLALGSIGDLGIGQHSSHTLWLLMAWAWAAVV